MDSRLSFQVEADHNEYLPPGARSVQAVLTVAASPVGAPADLPSAAEVLIVDVSGSMGMPEEKLLEAKRATAAAIDALRDGVAFAVIAGTSDARLVYPMEPTMVPATGRTREEAKAAVFRLRAGGGTAIGRWLHLANWLLAGQEAEVKQAILLTDGRNEHENAQILRQVLDGCEGRFVCHVRGVGTDWAAAELRQVASALLGTADGLEDPALLPVAFRTMTESVMGKAVADVSLRVWTPSGACVESLHQVHPYLEDLTDRRRPVSTRIGDYPTGDWGTESRDYHLCLRVEPDEVGEELLVARVGVVTAGRMLAERLLLVRSTDDTVLSAPISPQVAHYTGQTELAVAIQEGLRARDAGDLETATARLGRAVALATESGHEDTARLLARVVDVVDAPTGTVRLKRRIAGVDAEMVAVRSVRTVRVRKAHERGADDGGLPEGT